MTNENEIKAVAQAIARRVNSDWSLWVVEASRAITALDELRTALLAAEQAAPEAASEGADTGNIEADRVIARLCSSDPDFDDCNDAVAFIRKLVVEHRGPDEFLTWKDAAITERMQRPPPTPCPPTGAPREPSGAAIEAALSAGCHITPGDNYDRSHPLVISVLSAVRRAYAMDFPATPPAPAGDGGKA